jgi:hypothetical protein
MRAFRHILGLFLVLFAFSKAAAQLPDTISPADSAAFVSQAQRWTIMPQLSELTDWQMLLLAQVEGRRSIGMIRFFEQEYQKAQVLQSEADLVYDLMASDTAVSKEQLKSYKADQKNAAKATKKAKSNLDEAMGTARQLDQIGESTPANARKKLPKALSRLDRLTETARQIESPTIVVAPVKEEPSVEPESEDKKPKKERKKRKEKPQEEEVTSTDSDDNSEKKPKKNRKKKKEQPQEREITADEATDPAVPTEDVAVTPTESTSSEPDTTGKVRRNPFQRLLKDKKDKKEGDGPTEVVAARYDPTKDVMVSPPDAPCVYAAERKDEFTGSVYRECGALEVFRYSNPVMKKALPEGQYHIIGKAALATDGAADAALTLSFRIQDQNARRTFGVLPKGGILTMRFIRGDAITLYNSRDAEPEFDVETGVATYKTTYPLDRSLLKRIEKYELDQIRVQWSTGYEDYSIQQVDILQQQVRCLR